MAHSVIVTTMVQGSNNVYPHPIYRREALDQVGINATGGGPATILLTRRLLDSALPYDAARVTTSTHHEFFPMAEDTWPGGSYLAAASHQTRRTFLVRHTSQSEPRLSTPPASGDHAAATDVRYLISS